MAATAPPNAPATDQAELNVRELENQICQLLADLLQLHEKLQNGALIVKIQHKQFSFVQLTFDHKPQVEYPATS